MLFNIISYRVRFIIEKCSKNDGFSINYFCKLKTLIIFGQQTNMSIS